MENQEATKEQIEALVIRQSKLNTKLQAEIGNLISMNLEQQIIIEELSAARDADQGDVSGPEPVEE